MSQGARPAPFCTICILLIWATSTANAQSVVEEFARGRAELVASEELAGVVSRSKDYLGVLAQIALNTDPADSAVSLQEQVESFLSRRIRGNQALITAVIEQAVTRAHANPLELQQAVVQTITRGPLGAGRLLRLAVKDSTNATELSAFYELILVADLLGDGEALRVVADVAETNGADLSFLQATMTAMASSAV